MTQLRPMTHAEFSHWRAQVIPAYAADKVRSGRWSPQESVAEAEKEFVSLLPQGQETPGHVTFTIESDAGQCVGALWLARAERADGPIGYVYDLVIWPEHRRKGHAAAAMRALEDEAAARGFNGLALHVFGHNASAQRLYAALGYQATNLNLFKPLAPARGGEEAAAPPAPQRDVRFVVVHAPGPRWDHSKSLFEQDGVQAHIDHYRQLHAAGKLAWGGPFLDGGAGGMMIAAAGLAEEEITTFALADPAVRSGLLKAEVRPWMIAMRQ